MLDSFLTPARVVPVLMTLAGSLVGVVSAWLAAHFPGLPSFSQAEITALIVTGLGGGIAKALHWQRGWQKYEERNQL